MQPIDHKTATKLFDLLILALPSVEEAEQFNKPKGPRLSAEMRRMISGIDPEAGA